MPEQSASVTDFQDVHALAMRADTVIDKAFSRVKPLSEYLYLPFYKGETGFLEEKDVEIYQQFEFAYCNTPKPKDERYPEEVYIGRDPYEEYRTLRHGPEFTACFIHRGEIDDEVSVLTPPHDEKVLKNDLTWATNMVENDMDQFVTFWSGNKELEDRYHDSKKRYHDWNCDAYFLCNERPCGSGCVHFRLCHSTVVQHMYMWRNHKASLDFFPMMGESVTLNQVDFSKLMPYHKEAESAITCRECEVVWPTVWAELGGDNVNIYDKQCLQWTTPVGCRDVVELFNGWVPDEEEYERIIKEYVPPTLEKFDVACLPLLVLIDLIPYADEIDRYEETADEYSLFNWNEVSMCGSMDGYYERSNLLKWDDPEFKEKYPDLDPDEVPWLAYKFQWVPTAIRITLKGKFRPAIRAAWYDFMYHSLRHSIGVREVDGTALDAIGTGTTWTAYYENRIQPCLDVCDMLLKAGMGWLPAVPVDSDAWQAYYKAAFGELYTERMICARNGAVCETMDKCSPEEGLCDKSSTDSDSMRKCGGCFCSDRVVKPEDCHVGTCEEEVHLPWYGGCDNTACTSQGGNLPEGEGKEEADMPQAEDTQSGWVSKNYPIGKIEGWDDRIPGEGTVIAVVMAKITDIKGNLEVFDYSTESISRGSTMMEIYDGIDDARSRMRISIEEDGTIYYRPEEDFCEFNPDGGKFEFNVELKEQDGEKIFEEYNKTASFSVNSSLKNPTDIDKHPILFKTHAYTYNVLEGTVRAGEQHKIDEEVIISEASGFIQGGTCCTCLGPTLPNYYLEVPMIEIGKFKYEYEPYYEDCYYYPEPYSCDPESCDPGPCPGPGPGPGPGPEPDPCPCDRPYGTAVGWNDKVTSLTTGTVLAQVSDVNGNIISYGAGDIVLNQVPMGEVLQAVIGQGFGYPVPLSSVIEAADGKVYGIKGLDGWIPCDAIVEIAVIPSDGNPPGYLYAFLTDCDEHYYEDYYYEDYYYYGEYSCCEPSCDPYCTPDYPYQCEPDCEYYYYDEYYCYDPYCCESCCPSDCEPYCDTDCTYAYDGYYDAYYDEQYYYGYIEDCNCNYGQSPEQPPSARFSGTIVIDATARNLTSRSPLKVGLMDAAGNILCESETSITYLTEYYMARYAATAFNTITQYNISAVSSNTEVRIECDAYSGNPPTAYVRGENMAGKTIMWSAPLSLQSKSKAVARTASMMAASPQAVDEPVSDGLEQAAGANVHPAVAREEGYTYWSNPNEYIWPVDKLYFDLHEGYEVRDYCGARSEPWELPPVDMSAGGMLTTALVFDGDTDACKGEDADPSETRYYGWAALLWGEWLSNSMPKDGTLGIMKEQFLVPPWKIGMAGDKTWDNEGNFTGGEAALKCVDLTDPAWPGGTFHEAYRSRGGYVCITPFYGPVEEGEFIRGNTSVHYYEDIPEDGDIPFSWPELPYQPEPAHYRKYAGVLLELFTHGNPMTADMLLPYYSDNPGVNWTSDAEYIFNPYTATPEMTQCRQLATAPPGKGKIVLTVKSRTNYELPDPWETIHDQEREQFGEKKDNDESDDMEEDSEEEDSEEEETE